MFVAKDVCEVLGISKYRDALDRMDADERGSVRVDTPGGIQEVGAFTENGLYTVWDDAYSPVKIDEVLSQLL